MAGQWFETKKALLEYLGKDVNDRKLVDRMIHDGRACVKDGMYYLTSKDEIIRELEEEVKRLKKSESKEGRHVNEDADAISELEEKVKELESDLEFQISENERLEADKVRYQEAIKNSYLYMINVLKKKMDWYTYKATIKLEWEIKWEDNQ